MTVAMKWLWLSLAGAVTAGGDAARWKPQVQTTVYSSDGCRPCERYIEAIQSDLKPIGWIVRNATDADAKSAHIVIDKTGGEMVEVYPTTVIRRNGREVDRLLGRMNSNVLASTINREARKHQQD